MEIIKTSNTINKIYQLVNLSELDTFLKENSRTSKRNRKFENKIFQIQK